MLSSCQSVPGSLVPAGDKSRQPCFLGKESRPPSAGASRDAMSNRPVGREPVVSPQAPVGSGGRLRSGSSLSQDCARLVLLGFRGAVRRPRSEGPEMNHSKPGTQGGLTSWVLTQASAPGCCLSLFHAVEGDLMWGPKPQGSPKPPLR